MTSHLSTFERDNVQRVVMRTRAFLKGWNLWDLNEFHSCMQITLPVLTLGVSFYASQHSIAPLLRGCITTTPAAVP